MGAALEPTEDAKCGKIFVGNARDDEDIVRTDLDAITFTFAFAARNKRDDSSWLGATVLPGPIGMVGGFARLGSVDRRWN